MERDADPPHPRPPHDDRATKQAMLRDWGSWDASFNAITTELRRTWSTSCTARARTSSCRSRAAAPSRSRPRSATSCRATARCWCRQRRLLRADRADPRDLMGREHGDPRPRRGRAGHARRARGGARARCRASPTWRQVHCETGTGVLNPLPEIAAVCARHGKGLIVDAMSSFGAMPIDAREVRIDAVVAASGKCIEGVPGMGFVIARRTVMESAAATRTRSRWTCTTSTLHAEDRPVALHAAHPRGRRVRRGARPVQGGGRPAGAAARATARTASALDRRHGGARLRAVPRARDPGADHRHLPRAGRSGLRLQARSTRRSRRAATSSIPASSPRSRPSAWAASARSGPNEMRKPSPPSLAR